MGAYDVLRRVGMALPLPSSGPARPARSWALRQVHYDGWITIEAFGRALPQLAAATRVWRDLSPTPEDVCSGGFKLIRDGWRLAQS
jgi:hypothetical protein